MPKLSDLKLDEGAAPAVDWDAPESGQTAPPVYPGIYTLRFKMPESIEDWFDENNVNMVKGDPSTAKKFLVVNYIPDILTSHTTREAEGVAVPLDPSTNLPLHLGPQRASFYKTDRMMISEGGELLRALGCRLQNIKNEIEGALTQVNGRVTFMAEIGWKAYFKSNDVTVTTHPRGKKSGNLTWPRGANGQVEILAVNPSTGEKSFGYAIVAKIIPPHSS